MVWFRKSCCTTPSRAETSSSLTPSPPSDTIFCRADSASRMLPPLAFTTKRSDWSVIRVPSSARMLRNRS